MEGSSDNGIVRILGEPDGSSYSPTVECSNGHRGFVG